MKRGQFVYRQHGHIHGHDIPEPPHRGAMARCCCRQWIVFELRGDEWVQRWHPVRGRDLQQLKRMGLVDRR